MGKHRRWAYWITVGPCFLCEPHCTSKHILTHFKDCAKRLSHCEFSITQFGRSRLEQLPIDRSSLPHASLLPPLMPNQTQRELQCSGMHCVQRPLVSHVPFLIDYALTHWDRDKMDAMSQTTFSKCIFLNENVWIPIKISLKFVPKGPINNIQAMVQIMAWRRPGDKPLSEPMMVSLTTHIFVARPR